MSMHRATPPLAGGGVATITANLTASVGGGVWRSATGTVPVNDTSIRGGAAPSGPDVLDGGIFVGDGDDVPPKP